MGMTKVWQGMAKKNRHMVRGGCRGVFLTLLFLLFRGNPENGIKRAKTDQSG